MEVLGDWVVQRLSGGAEAPLGNHAMKVLEKLLAGPIQLHAPLAFAAGDDDAAIHNLTPQQFHILTAISFFFISRKNTVLERRSANGSENSPDDQLSESSFVAADRKEDKKTER